MSTLPLYGEYFGLTSQAFSVSPDPKFLYSSPSHKEGLAQLAYGIQARRGFVVLTGEVGTGKTTLIRSLLQQLSDGRTRIAFIFTLITNIRDLLRTVCEDFGLATPKEPPKDLHDYLALINEFLLESYKNNEGVALIIDEAQNLSREVLEGVRLLSNYETSEDKLLQILLIGQPELDARLNEPELRQLKQRVALRWHLNPLSPIECEQYISRRLEIAGGSGAIFPAKTMRAVHAYSGGIPRLINIICDNGMLTAYALSERYVTVAMIDEVARDLNLSTTPRKPAPVTTAIIPIKFPEALAAQAEPKSPPPPIAAAVPPLPRVEQNAAVAFDLRSQPIQLPEAPAAEAEPARPEPASVAAVSPPPRVDENAAAVRTEPQPPPDIQSAARAALEAAQQRAAEIQQSQARTLEARERSFPKPTLAPKAVFPKPADQPEPAPADAKEPEAEIVATARPEPEAQIVHANVKPEAEIIDIDVKEPEERIIETEAPAPETETVPPQSIHRLVTALTEAMGPMASLVVRDHVDAMGESTENFPKRRFHELVYATSGEILSQSLRARYESLMSREVRALDVFEE
jgi:general secretion pathway protein A